MTKIFKTLASAMALAGLATLMPTTLLADGPAAIAKAAQHAGLAAGSDNIGAVHTHLHHTLNCLVGPGGEGFDEDQANPCGADGGAIPQTADADMKGKLVELAAQVQGGIGNDDVAAAKEVAMSVQEMLASDG